jgi:hypothetical protein
MCAPRRNVLQQKPRPGKMVCLVRYARRAPVGLAPVDAVRILANMASALPLLRNQGRWLRERQPGSDSGVRLVTFPEYLLQNEESTTVEFDNADERHPAATSLRVKCSLPVSRDPCTCI